MHITIKTAYITLILLFSHSYSYGANENTIMSDDSMHSHDGTIINLTYNCSSQNVSKRQMYVYLPPSYYESAKRYPVLYLLHGAGGNESSWICKGRIIESIDSLYKRHEIGECIYVFPNMNSYHNDYDYGKSREKRSMEAFLGLDGAVEHDFSSDVVNYIDRNFRTIPRKEFRAIAGLSLGGLQTLYISANNPEFFNHIGLFSPVIYPPAIISKHDYIYKELETKLSSLFSSHPDTYWILTGEDDIFYNSAYFFSRLLDEQGYPHLFSITEGGHTWKNWKAYSVLFLKELWSIPESLKEYRLQLQTLSRLQH